MKVDKEYLDDLIILRPYGRIDTLSAGEFQDMLFDVLDEDLNIMIDLKETEYISSSGLRVFLAAK